MTQQQETVASIVAPMAEARVPCVRLGELANELGRLPEDHECDECDGSGEKLDSRFEALRGEHANVGRSNSPCRKCGKADVRGSRNPNNQRPPYCIDASLGALVRAAAACGLVVARMERAPDGSWEVDLEDADDPTDRDPECPQPLKTWEGIGETPEIAIALALGAWRNS